MTVYNSCGITISEAVNIFLHKSIMVGGIPFDVRENETYAKGLKKGDLDYDRIFEPIINTNLKPAHEIDWYLEGYERPGFNDGWEEVEARGREAW